jgi:hypothetical protein
VVAAVHHNQVALLVAPVALEAEAAAEQLQAGQLALTGGMQAQQAAAAQAAQTPAAAEVEATMPVTLLVATGEAE